MQTDVNGTVVVKRRWLKNSALLVIAFVLGGVLLPNIRVSWRMPATEAQGSGLNVRPGEPQKALADDEFYARAAQGAYRSVVNIDTTERVRIHGLFEDFEEPRYSEQQSHGSGVIVTADGYILTNEHVVGGANESGRHILVTLTDGKKFPGTVVGADHQTDVALVHVNAVNLPAAKMGTERGLVPGQMVVALGNPLDLRFTVTHGVVSALGRPISTPEGRIYADLIQHDALINPGNSGGALVNLQGQVIGINTLVYSSAQGIGFAIPIDTALHVANDLKRYGKIKRPWLGLVPMTNSPQIALRYDLPNVRGVVVARLWPDGPAAQAGLQGGDIITRVNGTGVATEDDFKHAESSLRIGESVKLTLLRGNQTGDTSLIVGEAP